MFHIIVVEAVDVVDLLILPDAPKNTRTEYDVNAEIALLSDRHEFIDSYTTRVLKYEKGMLNMNKENCVFNGVCDTAYLRCSMFAFEANYRSRMCCGIVDIPISRLEENVTVRKYYRCICNEGVNIFSFDIL